LKKISRLPPSHSQFAAIFAVPFAVIDTTRERHSTTRLIATVTDKKQIRDRFVRGNKTDNYSDLATRYLHNARTVESMTVAVYE
jgi:hypothetical protein